MKAIINLEDEGKLSFHVSKVKIEEEGPYLKGKMDEQVYEFLSACKKISETDFVNVYEGKNRDPIPCDWKDDEAIGKYAKDMGTVTFTIFTNPAKQTIFWFFDKNKDKILTVYFDFGFSIIIK